jgi:hypothetical protein
MFLMFWGYSVFLLLAVRKFLDSDRRFALTMCSNVRRSHFTTNGETLLYLRLHLRPQHWSTRPQSEAPTATLISLTACGRCNTCINNVRSLCCRSRGCC